MTGRRALDAADDIDHLIYQMTYAGMQPKTLRVGRIPWIGLRRALDVAPITSPPAEPLATYQGLAIERSEEAEELAVMDGEGNTVSLGEDGRLIFSPKE